MVPQDTVLFNDTIRYNIRYGRWEATRRRSRGSGAARADRQLHPHVAERLRDRSRRARPEIVRRRKAARRHRAHDPESAADPAARRGDVGARQPHREGNPGCARARVAQPHHAGDRAPALHHRRRRRDHRARHRARSPSAAPTAIAGKGGLYASMWNSQREAEAAREKLALAGEECRGAEPQSAAGRGCYSAARPAAERRRVEVAG